MSAASKSAITVLIGILALVGSTCEGQTYTYNFEAPVFAVGDTTPMNNLTPNIGPQEFFTSFASAPTSNGMVVSAFNVAYTSYGFSNQHLVDNLGGAVESLNLTFSKAINKLDVDFSVNSLSGGQARLDMTSSSGNSSQTAGPGTFFSGGHFTFESMTAFNSASFFGFNIAGLRTEMAFDNFAFSITPVPEPSSLVLISSIAFLGMGVQVVFRNRNAWPAKTTRGTP